MFRLDRELGEQRTRLIITGDISTECTELLEKSCEEAIKDGSAVDLVLKEVTSIDEAGRALLRRLAAKGVCLSANGLYHSHLVEIIRRTVSSTNSDRKRDA
jgi:hypothetical protein